MNLPFDVILASVLFPLTSLFGFILTQSGSWSSSALVRKCVLSYGDPNEQTELCYLCYFAQARGQRSGLIFYFFSLSEFRTN